MKLREKFGRKPKGKPHTGRATKVTSIMISKELKERLAELKDAYEICFDISVTYDQLLSRWADNVGRFDKQVLPVLEKMREDRQKENERMAAGLGLTAEQLKSNMESYDPAGEDCWRLAYSFVKDGEEAAAFPGTDSPFVAMVDGVEVDMASLLADGWTLISEIGAEIDYETAVKISRVLEEKTRMTEESMARFSDEESEEVDRILYGGKLKN